jgi:hypothetical protein
VRLTGELEVYVLTARLLLGSVVAVALASCASGSKVTSLSQPSANTTPYTLTGSPSDTSAEPDGSAARQAPPQPPVLCTWNGTPTPDGHLIVNATTASVTIGFTSSAASGQMRTANLRVVSSAGRVVYDYAAAHGGSPPSTAVTQPTTLTLDWRSPGQLPAGDYDVSVPVMVDGQILANCTAGWRVTH